METLNNQVNRWVPILNEYRNKKIDLPEFIEKLCRELGRVSGTIEVTDSEASEILGFLVDDLAWRITNPNKTSYNPDYRFSLEKLELMEENLKAIFGQDAKSSLQFIQSYKNSHPNLKKTSLQQYNVKNPRFFQKIYPGDILKAYLFGFMCADGYIETSGIIGLELNVKDKEVLTKFAEAIKLDKYQEKIKERTIFHNYKGEIKKYFQARLRFRCKPMEADLKNLEFSSSKTLRKSVPNPIKELIRKAIDMVKKVYDLLDEYVDIKDWGKTQGGKTALAWLLGFYDGDGSYYGRSSGIIYSASKMFLSDVKKVFNIRDHDVKTKIEPGSESYVFDIRLISKGYYYLILDSIVFDLMMDS